MLRCIPCALCAVAIITAGAARADARTKKKRKTAREYRFDGYGLGTSFGTLYRRAPYNQACDDDPVDGGRRRAMVYGALPCRGKVFPAKTTLVLFLKSMRNPAHRYALPIAAIAYVNGRYFKKRTGFPVHPGQTMKRARKKLGRALGNFRLTARGIPPITVHRFQGDIRILAEGKLVRGVVVGPMPRSPRNEQWRLLMQMIRRYTPISGRPPPRPSGLTRLCTRVWKRLARCYGKSRRVRRMISEGNAFARKCRYRAKLAGERKKLLCVSRSKKCKVLEACYRR